MTDIYIIDDDTQNRRDWGALTGSARLTSVSCTGYRLTQEDGRELLDGTSGVVFIHEPYCPKDALPYISKNYPNLVLIQISGAGLPNGPRGDRYWSVGRAVGKPTDEMFAKRAQDFLRDYDKVGTPIFRRLEPNVEPILALRLLCEAWLATGGRSSKTFDNQITIHAPTKAADWFMPFQVSPNEEGVKAIIELLGDAREDTEALLKAIAGLRSRNGEAATLVPSLFRKSISDLLQKLRSHSSTTGVF